MQIRYKGMFEAVELASVWFATRHPTGELDDEKRLKLDDKGKPLMKDVERTRTIYQGETATILGDPAEVEADARRLLEQEDNYEPVDASAKNLLKLMVKEREAREKLSQPDQPILEAVAGVGGVQ